MYIDFHTHAFTDAIAERAVDKLEKIVIDAGYEERAQTRGTVAQLLEKMDEWGVDRSVVLPIATKPSQQRSINDWAAQVMNDRIYCFGTVHPDAEDALDELERVKSLGLRGIKLHPDYQDFFANEEKMFPIYGKCAELGLPVIFHAGFDVLSPDFIHCTPQMSAEVADRFPELTMILAHLGGNMLWDDVEKYLVGKNVYLDTAFIDGHIDDGQLLRIIRNHGADKILLASDCPWHPASREIEMLKRLNLSESEMSLICCKNALRLLGDT